MLLMHLAASRGSRPPAKDLMRPLAAGQSPPATGLHCSSRLEFNRNSLLVVPYLHNRENEKGSNYGVLGRYGVSVPALHKRPRRNNDQYAIASLVGPAGDPWDQRVRSQLIGKDLVTGLLVYELPLSRAASGLRPYHFTYPKRRLTMEEMLYKFIDEGKREHEEMGAFIYEFQIANEILFKERNNSLSELKFELPSKEKDPGSFTIPCDISQLHINNALADLGASISLMLYTMYEKLGLGEPKATRMSLELADRSIQYPRGITENMLTKVHKFVLPIDFVILDMPEDSRIPIILERPFLATAQAMIDVFNKKRMLRVGDDEVIFDVNQSFKRPPAGLEKSINQSDLESCECFESKADDDSDPRKPIRHIDSVNTPYSVAQEIARPDKVESEHLYSASANEIDEKKPELKDLPRHLEYAYLIKSLLNAASITAAHIKVNAAQLFNATEGVNAASEEVSTVELLKEFDLLKWDQQVVSELVSLRNFARRHGSSGEDEAVHKELGDSLVRAATTASSLEAEQDN
ncbi:DNA-directed DNA polymerase, partial [Tanacetum coccineum]